MNEKNIHTDSTFLGLTRELLEGGDPQTLQTRLEDLKELVIPGSRAQRARYTRLLEEAARVAALEELTEQHIDPISRAAFQALEWLEAQSDGRPLKGWEEAGFAGEELATVAIRIDTADSPEIIREAIVTVLRTIVNQKEALTQELWRTSVQRMLEEKILVDEMLLHPSRALFLWDALRRSPVKALAIPLLWYDGEKECFRSAAPEDLVCMNTLG